MYQYGTNNLRLDSSIMYISHTGQIAEHHDAAVYVVNINKMSYQSMYTPCLLLNRVEI